MLFWAQCNPRYRWLCLLGLLLAYPALVLMVHLSGERGWLSAAVLIPVAALWCTGLVAGNGLAVFTVLLFWFLALRETEPAARSALLVHVPVALMAWGVALFHHVRLAAEQREHGRTLDRLRERLALARDQYKTDLVVNVSNQKKFKKYSDLNRASRVFGSQLALDKLADKVLAEVRQIIGAERGRYLVSFEFPERTEAVCQCLPPDAEQKQQPDDPYTRWTLQHRTPLLVSDTQHDFRFQAPEPGVLVRNLMLVPMLSAGHVFGLLRAESPWPDIFTKDDLRLFTLLGDLAGVAAENANLYQCAQELAITDGLTGLYLRRFFNQRFAEELQRFREHGEAFSLLILDIDHFKRINDRLGHLAGDQVLAQFGEALKAEARVMDLVCRFGGEEFALILPHTAQEGALVMAERIRDRIAQRGFQANTEVLHLTISGGVGECPRNGKDMNEIIRQTDAALYQAKRQGRNRILAAGAGS
ncbi:MAG: sensor domain-containing diguanylate cyclase [candidate division FCPU426 bacterium]